MQVIYLEVRKIYQPGYSGGRGERQKIYLVLEYELSSVAAILCVIVRPERTPQENLFGGRSGRMAEDQAAGMPPATETNAHPTPRALRLLPATQDFSVNLS